MDNSSSARKTLLPFDRVQFDDPDYSRHSRLLFHPDSQSLSQQGKKVQTAEQRRKLKLMQRLKDKSLVMVQKELAFYQKWMVTMDQRLPILHPQSRLLLLWNFIVLLSILFHLFQVPLSLFLTDQVYYSEMNLVAGVVLNTITVLVLFIDMIVVRVNISYYQKGKLITSRVSILRKYFSFQLWIDLISNLVLTIYIASGIPSLVYLKFVFYIKIYTLLKVDQAILHSLELLRIVYAVYRLARMIVFVWFLNTWAACIFFAIDYHFYLEQGAYFNAGQLWLTNTAAVGNLNLIQNFEWYVWYEYALYWAIQTSSTVGYGDLTPMNPPQVLYCNLIILLMTVLFAFFINSIWQIIGSVTQSSIQYTENWQNLKMFLGQSQIPIGLKQKLSAYLYEVWLDDDNDEIEQLILTKLSDDLRDQFYQQSRSSFFKSVPLFYQVSRNFRNSNLLIIRLSYRITEQKAAEDDIIYEEGNISPYLYYIRKGSVKLDIEGTGFGQQKQPQSIFGVHQFFTETPRKHSAQTLEFTKLWQLSYSDMLEQMRKIPQIYNKYCETKQKILIQKQILCLHLGCWKCKSSFHVIQNCPQINQWRKFLQKIGDLAQDRKLKREITLTRQQCERTYMERPVVKSCKIVGSFEQNNRVRNVNMGIDKVSEFSTYHRVHNI